MVDGVPDNVEKHGIFLCVHDLGDCAGLYALHIQQTIEGILGDGTQIVTVTIEERVVRSEKANIWC